MTQLNATDIKLELATRVADCLRGSDDLGLIEVGIYLDKALVALTGKGVPPPQIGAGWEVNAIA